MVIATFMGVGSLCCGGEENDESYEEQMRRLDAASA